MLLDIIFFNIKLIKSISIGYDSKEGKKRRISSDIGVKNNIFPYKTKQVEILIQRKDKKPVVMRVLSFCK